MRRSTVLGTMLAIGALSLTVSAYQQAPAEKVVTVDKVKDNLYVLKGGGGNTTVFIVANGVTVVDTKLAGWGQPIIGKIKELSAEAGDLDHQHPQPRRSHQRQRRVPGDGRDHHAGEHQEERRGVATGLRPEQQLPERDQGRRPRRAEADVQGQDDRRQRRRPIELFYFGRAHTNGDAFVLFPSLRVMAVGDVFPNKGIPIMDKNAGGSGVEFPATLAKALQRRQGRRRARHRPRADDDDAR